MTTRLRVGAWTVNFARDFPDGLPEGNDNLKVDTGFAGKNKGSAIYNTHSSWYIFTF